MINMVTLIITWMDAVGNNPANSIRIKKYKIKIIDSDTKSKILKLKKYGFYLSLPSGHKLHVFPSAILNVLERKDQKP